MKGISTILATILIVIIVVALVSLTYTFAVNMFTTASGSASAGVEQTTMRMDKAIAFVTNPTCLSNVVSFSIRHLGAKNSINETEISVYFGNQKLMIDSKSWDIGTLLSPGNTMFVNTTNAATLTGTQDVTISAPAAPITKTNVKCS